MIIVVGKPSIAKHMYVEALLRIKREVIVTETLLAIPSHLILKATSIIEIKEITEDVKGAK
jgi:hypothetical protein